MQKKSPGGRRRVAESERGRVVVSMPGDRIPAESFFEQALLEAGRYGEDRWVFLRELVQNSRDAGAACIDFQYSRTGDMETLSCQDDGKGMSLFEIENYLLRLYASSKNRTSGTLGFFGVGFWSVLLFRPERIRVVSVYGSAATALEIDCGKHTLYGCPVDKPQPGTRVTLFRPVSTDEDEESAMLETITERLVHFAGGIQPLQGKSRLDLRLNGRRLNRPLMVTGFLTRQLRRRRYQAVIGLGRQPSVRIYQAGLLVRELAALDEVIPSRPSRLPPASSGLYPEVAVNIDGLRLLMDRHTIFEDATLHEAVTDCERELIKLYRRLLHRLCPLDLENSLLQWWLRFRENWRWIAAGFGAMMLLLLLLTGLAGPAGLLPAAGQWFRGRVSGAHADQENQPVRLTVDRIFDRWRENRLQSGGAPVEWDFLCRGPARQLFQARVLNGFDRTLGFYPEPEPVSGPYPEIAGQPDDTVIRIGVSGKPGSLVLPVPPGFGVAEGRVRQPAGRPLRVMMNGLGEPLVELEPAETGPLEYRVTPLAFGGAALPPAPVADDVKLPGQADWPAGIIRLVDRARAMELPQRVVFLESEVRRLFVYRSGEPRLDPARFRMSWLERCWENRSGDCDVLNGVLVLLLRGAGIPARLVVGFNGWRDGVQPQLHAWAVYYQGNWRQLDLTPPLPPPAMNAAGEGPPGPASVSGDVNPATGAFPGWFPGADSTSPLPLIVLIGGSGVLLAAGWQLLLRGRLRRSLPREVLPVLANLLQHHYSGLAGAGETPFHFRPVFPAITGRRLSLHQLHKIADHSPLLSASPGCPLLTLIGGHRQILDASAEIFRMLIMFLPPVLDLDELSGLAHRMEPPAWLAEAEAVIRSRQPGFRLLVVPGSTLSQEASIPFRRKTGLGCHQLVLGDRHPDFHRLLELSAAGSRPVVQWVQEHIALLRAPAVTTGSTPTGRGSQ